MIENWENYKWRVAQSGNPNKAWLMHQNVKISALMGLKAARSLAMDHNMTVDFISGKVTQ